MRLVLPGNGDVATELLKHVANDVQADAVAADACFEGDDGALKSLHCRLAEPWPRVVNRKAHAGAGRLLAGHQFGFKANRNAPRHRVSH